MRECDAWESDTSARNSARFRGEDIGMKNKRMFLPADKCLLIVALCISSFAITGCVDSVNYLASDSRLPKWFTLPPGLRRADVTVVRAAMDTTRRGVDIKVALFKGKAIIPTRQVERHLLMRTISFCLAVCTGF